MFDHVLAAIADGFVDLATAALPHLLPPDAVVGIAASFLFVLECLLQGFSADGELGNAVAFLVEWAPRNRRALFSSLQQCSTIGGTLLGSGAAALLASSLSAEALQDWGWRLPFIFGGLCIAPLGWFLRRGTEETPAFEPVAATSASAPASAKHTWSAGLQTLGLAIVWTVSLHVFLNYLPSFLPKHTSLISAWHCGPTRPGC